MKKAKSEERVDWGKREYKRSDLGEFVRGKYAKRIRESTNVIVLDPQVAKFFPNDRAVNDALRQLLAANPKSDSNKQRSRLGQKRRVA